MSRKFTLCSGLFHNRGIGSREWEGEGEKGRSDEIGEEEVAAENAWGWRRGMEQVD